MSLLRQDQRPFLVTYTVPCMHVGMGPELTNASSDASSIGAGMFVL